MCTLTLLRRGGRGCRLAFNRDERRDRVPGERPSVREVRGVRIVSPRDPEGGGSWIAVNDHGLLVAILNGNPPAERRGSDDGGGSRGALVRVAAEATTLDRAADAVAREAVGIRRPFRLLATDGDRLLRATLLLDPRRTPVEIDLERWSGAPLMLASSGVGDHLVEPARRRHFDRWFADGVDDARQDAFHASVEPLRPHLAVMTSRPEARTVSRTVATLDPEAGITVFRHRDEPASTDDTTRASAWSEIELPLAAGALR